MIGKGVGPAWPSGQRVLRIEDPPIARTLFGDTRWAWIWAILRLYLGWEWLSHGWAKFWSPAWIGNKAGTAMTGFVAKAMTKTEGQFPDVQGWYAWFLQTAVQPSPVLWSYLIVLGEILVGAALIVGLFTGIAAFFGSFMNMSFLLAGTVSINPILFAIATWLVLAWKTAGWWGLDRWALTLLGTPWSPGRIFGRDDGRETAGELELEPAPR